MPSFFTSGNTAAFTGAIRGWNFITRAGLHVALVVGGLVLVVRLAEEGQRRPVGPGRRLDHVRREPLAGDVVAVGQVAAAAFVLRLAVRAELDFKAALGVLDELAFHVAPQVEVAAMGDAFQLAELALRRGTGTRTRCRPCRPSSGSVRRWSCSRSCKPSPARPSARVPRHPAVAPVLVPLPRRIRGGRRTRSPSARTRASGT